MFYRRPKIGQLFTTHLKYFISYFIVFSVLIIGFFFIIKFDLSKRYLNQLSEQSLSQLHTLTTELTDDLLFLEQINNSLRSNIDLINARYNNSGWQDYQAWKELQKYASANQLVDSICYTNKLTGKIAATNQIIFYENSLIRITSTSDNNKYLTFDPSPYYNALSGQLIFLSNNNMNQLIYFPVQSSSLDFFIFFILDMSEIKEYLQKIITDTVPAMILVDHNRKVVTGINSQQLTPYLDSVALENGIAKIDSNVSLCVHTGLFGEYSIVSLISNASLNQQLMRSFSGSYLLFFGLSCIGFLLVLWSMKITYLPLHRLAEKLVPGFSKKQEYLTQLDSAFTDALNKNHQLEYKLKNYQISIKKSLLDSVIESSYSGMNTALPDIDQLFDPDIYKELFVVKMKSPLSTFPHTVVKKIIQGTLTDKDSCIILQMNSDSVLFLLNYTGSNTNKKEILLSLLSDICQEQGCFSSISNSSKSPLDIPSLCENAIQASKFWTETPVVDFEKLQLSSSTAFTYPHDKLEELDKMLRNMNIVGAQRILKDIHQIISTSSREENPLPDFFIRSILVDLITLIISYINQAKISSESYSELYYETLYYCRSCSYTEKAVVIESNINKLLEIYHQEAGTYISSAQIKQLIEESYCQPNFSIYELADKLQISFTYASNLIKKKLNQNFSDYLWTLRFEKAKELLTTTDMSIDEISVAVGYLNPSSFRRKFKQETGITPSQYRTAETLQTK